MNNKNKIERLEHLRQNYLILREFVIYYKNILDYNESKEKNDVKVKKLVLTKPFYGKDLVVG